MERAGKKYQGLAQLFWAQAGREENETACFFVSTIDEKRMSADELVQTVRLAREYALTGQYDTALVHFTGASAQIRQ